MNFNKLYIIKIDGKYLICKSTIKNNTYREIFTNEKIKIKENDFIKPLILYYSRDEQLNINFTKKHLIEKYNEINNFYNNKEKILKQNEKTLNKCKSQNEIALEKIVQDFFPITGEWSSNAFYKDENSLICHLRDSNWLASKIQKKYNLNDIDFIEIYDFVETSELFKQLRHEYEQKIVKWQIMYMYNDGENWIADEKYGGDFIFWSEFCDLGFRKGVVDTLEAIGLDTEAIEEGLEKNANLWRDFYIKKAFDNKFNHILISSFFTNKTELEPTEQEHKNKWIKLRKYEYYQQHKQSVDRYGIVEDDMKLSLEEVNKLKNYLSIKNMERLEYMAAQKKKVLK